jgi:hypothetical protein
MIGVRAGVQSAGVRGEKYDTRPADAGPALFLHRLVQGGGHRTVGWADRIVDQLLGPES